MSEALERVSGIRQLPIFPLPLVMVPGEVLPLHIFEDRYRKMLSDISAGRNLFGLTFFEPDEAFIDRPAPVAVGCAAEVRQSDLLPDGRSNILTFGIIRFRLTDYTDAGEPYLTANIDFFEDDEAAPAGLGQLADEVFASFERIAKAAFKMGGSRGQFPEIQRTDPESLSFLITAAFNFDNEKKYNLLKMTSTADRLSDLKNILDQTVGQMEESVDIQIVARTNGHSKKKIDL